MDVLYVIFMPVVIALLFICTVKQIIMLFRDEEPIRKKKTMSIEEAREMLWLGYTNAYFDFD